MSEICSYEIIRLFSKQLMTETEPDHSEEGPSSGYVYIHELLCLRRLAGAFRAVTRRTSTVGALRSIRAVAVCERESISTF